MIIERLRGSGPVIETALRGDERVRVTPAARRANAACGPSRAGAKRKAPLGEVRIFRLDLADEAPRDEDQRYEEDVESDDG